MLTKVHPSNMGRSFTTCVHQCKEYHVQAKVINQPRPINKRRSMHNIPRLMKQLIHNHQTEADKLIQFDRHSEADKLMELINKPRLMIQ